MHARYAKTSDVSHVKQSIKIVSSSKSTSKNRSPSNFTLKVKSPKPVTPKQTPSGLTRRPSAAEIVNRMEQRKGSKPCSFAKNVPVSKLTIEENTKKCKESMQLISELEVYQTKFRHWPYVSLYGRRCSLVWIGLIERFSPGVWCVLRLVDGSHNYRTESNDSPWYEFGIESRPCYLPSREFWQEKFDKTVYIPSQSVICRAHLLCKYDLKNLPRDCIEAKEAACIISRAVRRWSYNRDLRSASPKSDAASISTNALLTSMRSINGDLQKCRIAYDWICSNLNTSMDSEGEAVNGSFSSRVSRCYRILLNEAGVDCISIHGWGKGDGYMQGDCFHRHDGSVISNHSWNAFKLDRAWFFADCAWGSGYVSGRFVRARTRAFFMTSPSLFALDHYPHRVEGNEHLCSEFPNPCFDLQLLHRPLSEYDFERAIHLHPRAHEVNLIPIHPKRSASVLQAGRNWSSIEFEADLDRVRVHVFWVLPEATISLQDGRFNEIIRYDTSNERNSNRFIVHVSFPHAGLFTVYVSDESKRKLFMLNYNVESTIHPEGNPKKMWLGKLGKMSIGQSDAFSIVTPLSCLWSSNERVRLCVNAPISVLEMFFCCNGTMTALERVEASFMSKSGPTRRFQGLVYIVDPTTMTVWCRFEGNDEYFMIYSNVKAWLGRSLRPILSNAPDGWTHLDPGTIKQLRLVNLKVESVHVQASSTLRVRLSCDPAFTIRSKAKVLSTKAEEQRLRSVAQHVSNSWEVRVHPIDNCNFYHKKQNNCIFFLEIIASHRKESSQKQFRVWYLFWSVPANNSTSNLPSLAIAKNSSSRSKTVYC